MSLTYTSLSYLAVHRLDVAAVVYRPASLVELLRLSPADCTVDSQWWFAVTALARDGFTSRLHEVAAGPKGRVDRRLAGVIAGAFLAVDDARVTSLRALTAFLRDPLHCYCGAVECCDSVEYGTRLRSAPHADASSTDVAAVTALLPPSLSRLLECYPQRAAERVAVAIRDESWVPPATLAQLSLADVVRLRRLTQLTPAGPAVAGQPRSRYVTFDQCGESPRNWDQVA